MVLWKTRRVEVLPNGINRGGKYGSLQNYPRGGGTFPWNQGRFFEFFAIGCRTRRGDGGGCTLDSL